MGFNFVFGECLVIVPLRNGLFVGVCLPAGEIQDVVARVSPCEAPSRFHSCNYTEIEVCVAHFLCGYIRSHSPLAYFCSQLNSMGLS